MAYTALGEFDRAEEDLNKWKEVDPISSADAEAQIQKLKVMHAKQRTKQKHQFKNFFART